MIQIQGDKMITDLSNIAKLRLQNRIQNDEYTQHTSMQIGKKDTNKYRN